MKRFMFLATLMLSANYLSADLGLLSQNQSDNSYENLVADLHDLDNRRGDYAPGIYSVDQIKQMRVDKLEMLKNLISAERNVVALEFVLMSMFKAKYQDIINLSFDTKLKNLEHNIQMALAMEIQQFVEMTAAMEKQPTAGRNMTEQEAEDPVEAEVNKRYRTLNLTPIGELTTGKRAKDTLRREVLAEIANKEKVSAPVVTLTQTQEALAPEVDRQEMAQIEKIMNASVWNYLRDERLKLRSREHNSTLSTVASVYKPGGRAYKTFAEEKYKEYQKFNIAQYLDNVAVVEFLISKLLEIPNTTEGSRSLLDKITFRSPTKTTTYTPYDYPKIVELDMSRKALALKEYFTEINKFK